MAATNSVRIIEDGPRNVVLLIEGNNGATGANPGSGGADLGTTTIITPAQVGYINQATQQRCSSFRVDRIEWDIQTESTMRVDLAWQASPDQVFQSCIGRANKFYKKGGGIYAPSTLLGATGGIDLSTSGAPGTYAAWTIVISLVKDGVNPINGITPFVFAEDDFIGSSGTLVESRPTNIGNKTWTTNAPGAFTLSGNGKVNATLQVNANAEVFDAGASDFSITCPMSSFSPDGNLCVIAVMMFRYVDAANNWGIQVDPRFNRVTVYNKQGGTQFDQMYIADATVVNNAVTTCRVDCIGSNITIWVNGVQIASQVATFNQTATKCGIYMGVNGPSGGNATWGPIKVTTFSGTNYRWPVFTPISANGGAPVVPLGLAGTWDATDIANPQPFFDFNNSRWAMLLSGYTAAAHPTNGNAANSNILNLGLWTAPTIDGPWTADVTNPVMLANGTDGFFSFNGGSVQIAGINYMAYVSDNGTDIRWATSPDLHTWTRVGLICSASVPANNTSWRQGGVFDPFIRVRQGSNLIEMWCCGVDGIGVKRLGLLTSSDLGATWVDQTSTIPAVLPPVGLFRNGQVGEPSVYVPPGREGSQYLISFDYVPQAQSGNPAVGRFIGQGISLDGGKTWAFRIAGASPGGFAWENLQVFDSAVVDVGDGTLRLLHSGANTFGPSLGLNIQIGQQNAPWGQTNLLQG